jgi:hypothetical protein
MGPLSSASLLGFTYFIWDEPQNRVGLSRVRVYVLPALFLGLGQMPPSTELKVTTLSQSFSSKGKLFV